MGRVFWVQSEAQSWISLRFSTSFLQDIIIPLLVLPLLRTLFRFLADLFSPLVVAPNVAPPFARDRCLRTSLGGHC